MASSDARGNASLLSRFFRRLRRVLWVFVQVLLCMWATLAIFFSNLPWFWARAVLAVLFALFCIWALRSTRSRSVRWALAACFVLVVVWFVSISPSHDRPWREEVGVMPRAIINGDRVRFTGYRNFAYRTLDDFDVRYEEREVDMSRLTSLDLYISYWSVGPVAHTFVSFNFDNAPPVCISIETRPEIGEGFDPLASMFKQFELIYVVGDERDLVRSRANYRDEEVYLYRVKTPSDGVRALFEVYLKRINELADHPEWYHLLKSNCSLNIVRYRNAAGREGSFDIRHLLNGWVDRYLYETAMLDTSMPFAELRRRSHINDVSRATTNTLSAAEFSRQIRDSRPEMGPHPAANQDPK